MKKGFTLAELLIALAILGVIATFTIPKILQSQGNSQLNAIAKESAGLISEAYQVHRLKSTVTSSMSSATLTQYLNYVKVETSAQFDALQGTAGSWDCDAVSEPCLRLHNGALLKYIPGDTFNGTTATHMIHFYLDPDGKYDGTANGSGKSVEFWLYYDGAIRTWGTGKPSSCGSWACPVGPSPSSDPSWFSW